MKLMINIFRKITSGLFGRKYLQIEDIKDSLLSFKKPNDDIFQRIFNEIGLLSISNNKSKIFKTSKAKTFDLENLKKEVQSQILYDYEDNLKKAKETGWDFEYGLYFSDTFPEALQITTKLNYPHNEVGAIFYSMVIQKIEENKYLFWGF